MCETRFILSSFPTLINPFPYKNMFYDQDNEHVILLFAILLVMESLVIKVCTATMWNPQRTVQNKFK